MNGCKRQDYNCPVLPLPARVTRVRVALATVCSQITQGFCNLGARNTEKLRVQEREISEQQDIVVFTVSAYSVASCGDVSVSLRVPPMRRTLTHRRLLTVVPKQARKPPPGVEHSRMWPMRGLAACQDMVFGLFVMYRV